MEFLFGKGRHKYTFRISYFGLENETASEDDMPLRIIGYDGAAYRDQVCEENLFKVQI